MSVSAQENQLRDGVYRGLINGLPNAAVLVFDTEQRYLMAHGDVLRTYQLFPESAKGKTPFEIMPKPIAQRVTHWYQRVLQGESIQEEISYETITFQLRIQPITNDAGEIIAGMVIAQDMTPLKQTQAQLEQRVKQLTILSEVESELSEHLNIDYVLTMALDSAVRLSEADAGFIALVDEEHLRHPHIIGDYRQTTLYADYKQPWGTISRAIKHQQAELIANVKADADYVAILPNTCAQIVVPLMAQDKLVGVLNLETSKAERFTPQTLDFVKLITSRVAMAIDNARLYQQTAEQLTEMQRLYQHVSKLE